MQVPDSPCFDLEVGGCRSPVSLLDMGRASPSLPIDIPSCPGSPGRSDAKCVGRSRLTSSSLRIPRPTCPRSYLQASWGKADACTGAAVVMTTICCFDTHFQHTQLAVITASQPVESA